MKIHQTNDPFSLTLESTHEDDGFALGFLGSIINNEGTWQADWRGTRRVVITPKPGVQDEALSLYPTGHRVVHGLLVCLRADGRATRVDHPDPWSHCPYCGTDVRGVPRA